MLINLNVVLPKQSVELFALPFKEAGYQVILDYLLMFIFN